MNKKEIVLNKFKNGFNCSEAIISAYYQELGLQKDTAMRIFKGLGGGMGNGEICGALSAGILIAGMRGDSKERDNRKELKETFLKKHGCLKCKELLKWDVTTEEGYNRIIEDGGFEKICPIVVGDVIEWLEERK